MRKMIAAAGVCILVACLLATAAESGSPGDEVVAEVNGARLTMRDIEQRDSSLLQARTVYYDAERKAIETTIDQVLLEQAARRENVSVDELLKKHVTSALPPDPSEEALRVYYEGIQTDQPFDSIRQSIIDHIRQGRMAKLRKEYVDSLRKQFQANILLSPPRFDIGPGEAPVTGPKDAPVTMVEYGDFECPYCQQVFPVLQKLRQEYNGKLAFSFRDMPLPMHSQAEKAAEAARCADLQGKYWEYHDLLFSTKRLDIPVLKNDAVSLKLDSAAFNQCLDSGQQAGVVHQELAQANKLGLSGTPSFFINGRFLSGVASYETLHQIVEEELASSKKPDTKRGTR